MYAIAPETTRADYSFKVMYQQTGRLREFGALMNGRHQDLRMQSCQSRFHIDICCTMTAVNVHTRVQNTISHFKCTVQNDVKHHCVLNEDSACRDSCISVEYAAK